MIPSKDLVRPLLLGWWLAVAAMCIEAAVTPRGFLHRVRKSSDRIAAAIEEALSVTIDSTFLVVAVPSRWFGEINSGGESPAMIRLADLTATLGSQPDGMRSGLLLRFVWEKDSTFMLPQQRQVEVAGMPAVLAQWDRRPIPMRIRFVEAPGVRDAGAWYPLQQIQERPATEALPGFGSQECAGRPGPPELPAVYAPIDSVIGPAELVLVNDAMEERSDPADETGFYDSQNATESSEEQGGLSAHRDELAQESAGVGRWPEAGRDMAMAP